MQDEGVVRGLECVIADLESVDDTYALAQIAYALALADRILEFDQVMNKLNERAETEGENMNVIISILGYQIK